MLEDITIKLRVQPMLPTHVIEVNAHRPRYILEHFPKFSTVEATVRPVTGREMVVSFLDLVGVYLHEPRCLMCNHGISEHGDRAVKACIHMACEKRPSGYIVLTSSGACNCTGLKLA